MARGQTDVDVWHNGGTDRWRGSPSRLG